MTNTLFILSFFALGAGIYFYSRQKWQKHESAFNEYAVKMQTDVLVNNTKVNEGIDYMQEVKAFYEDQGYSLSKHPNFSTDFIAKKEKNILFIRVQGLQNKQDITAKLYQEFVGQTVLYALDNPLYSNYELSWTYVCSKMMCDKSAKIYIKSYEDKLRFELIELKEKEA